MYLYPFTVVFGIDLTTLVKLEGGVIPEVLSHLFNEIQSRGNIRTM